MRVLTTIVVLLTACDGLVFDTDGGAGGGVSGGSTAGGSTAGGSTAGGSTAGGSTAGGSTAGGSTAGGSTAGGSTAGGSTAGGSTAGGSTAGGSTAGGSTAGGSTAGGSTAGGMACPSGQHVCGTSCVSDTSPATCGSRCTACPSITNATSTCAQGMCGFTCGNGFTACLGQCVSGSTCMTASLPANAFVKLTEHDTGTRQQAAMAYDSDAGVYLLIGGARRWNRVEPYDVLQLSLAESRWRNQFPFDRLGQWGPELGDSSAPNMPDERFRTTDSSGYPRPSFEVYGGMLSFSQFAWSEPRRTMHFYLWNRTFSYDAVSRQWSFPTPTVDPAGGPMKPRLMWGAMAHDPVSNRVLLVGGGNVLVASGEPGTWLFDPVTQTWTQVTTQPQPGPRAYTSLSVDPDRGQALLFGGDELDRLTSDTWIFDFASRTWSQPPVVRAPPARAGHRLVFLPQTRATVLLGGFTYTSTNDYVQSHYAQRPMELWRYDWAGSRWDLIKAFAAPEVTPTTGTLTFPAAAGAGDVVLLHFKNGSADSAMGSQTWAIRVDPSVTDPQSAARSVDAGTEGYRTGRFDPAWYADAGAPSPSELAAHAALVSGAPDNTWVNVTAPNRPASNHDWGTAAIDVARHTLLRWSGGHSAYCGTDVLHYDTVSNRFSIGFRPELPLEFDYSNDGVPGQWTFKRRPFMAAHTYKMYAFSPALDRMVIHKEPYLYFYDTAAKDFAQAPVESSIGGNMYTDVLTATPNGLAAWTPNGLFRLSAVGPWTTLNPTAVSGARLPQIVPDQNSMVYEPDGDRLLLFAGTGTDKGQVYSYGLADNTLRALSPQGRADMAATASSFMRESVYVPSQKLVVFAIGYGADRVPVYDVMENRWYAYRLAPQPFNRYGNSYAIVFDPTTDRVWAMDQRNEIRVLKVVKASADKLPLN